MKRSDFIIGMIAYAVAAIAAWEAVKIIVSVLCEAK